MSQPDSGEVQQSAHARYLGIRSFGSLDGLRAFSILAVLWHHTHDGYAGWWITKRGFLGVDLFFVISGFLIVTLLLRERRRTGDISLRGFYVRRFLRIFPPYYAMLLLVGAVAYLTNGHTTGAIRGDLPYALLYLSNLFPLQSMLFITWSLSTEEQFYVVVPTLEKHARKLFPLLLPAIYVLVSLPPFGLFPQLALPGFFRQTTFGPILLGVMLAHLLNLPRVYGWASRLLGHRWSPLGAAVLVLATCSIPAEDISGWIRLAIHGSLMVLVASCVLREGHVLEPFLTLWPLRRIGIVSYGIYLYHLLVNHAVAKVLERLGIASQLVYFLAASLASWWAAELSYRLFEVRFLALKDRFGAGGRPPQADAGGKSAPQ
jgi:peptidoglycan/LPS O-acetylase OafA/YrhL